MAHKLFPGALGCFVFCRPETVRQNDFNLIFLWPPFRFIARTTHHESTRWTPAKLEGLDLALFSSSSAFEGRIALRGKRTKTQCDASRQDCENHGSAANHS